MCEACTCDEPGAYVYDGKRVCWVMYHRLMGTTWEEIVEELADQVGVRRIAVENFLMGVRDHDKHTMTLNLSLDAKLYGWNDLTVRAIMDGLDIWYGR